MFTFWIKKVGLRTGFQKVLQKHPYFAYKTAAVFLFVIYILIFEFLMIFENQPKNANLITAIYWTTTTVATVGYGDVVFTSMEGRLFTIIVQVLGIILISDFLVTYVVTPWMDRFIKFRLPRKVPSSMKDHIIICGYNQLVETLIDELTEQDILFVVVEDEDELIKELVYKNISCIFGSPSDKQTLIGAGIERAKLLIANKSDKRNANIVLTAKEFQYINIIAIVEDLSKSRYLKYAGADTVVSPKSMFGQFIGKKALDRLVSRITEATEIFEGINIVEFPVYTKSPLIGKTLKEISSQQLTGAKIVGTWTSGTLTFDPKEEDIVRENSVLLAIGSHEELSKLKKLTYQFNI